MATTKWNLDAAHSELQFKVKHMMISTVTGQFNKFDASIETDGNDFTKSKIKLTAEIASISTNNEQRDAHLKTGDFFDAENHPQLVFESSKLEKVDDENYKLHGILEMRGNKKEVVLDVEYGGTMVDPYGLTRAGFSVTGKINRRDFGVNFSLISETGGVLVADEVKIIAAVEFVKEAKEAAVEAK